MKKDAKNSLELFQAATDTSLPLSVVENGISAGFPSPADDFLDNKIDLNKELIKNPSTTFYGRVKGDSMIGAGLDDGDLLVIDKSLEPRDNRIAVCFIDGEFTVKRIQVAADCIWLLAENDKYAPIKVTQDNDFLIWGIVINVIKNV
ncbi:MAG: LexA family protein [Flavicella sp.]